ncbi:TRAP-type C4-dicarboxylate transport system, substrate-binding protein [Faunimonas pinastri]|uniref:TRAP-type C4-dicarboxylate transport system, substrate-binding protein n=1 Tax=Faunimonas pinastri TaxID=1855383 RepID=A0A1H9Q5V7_9HYPH|nr:TRAP transporter substrate-binding protein [Faunimonas pinastri]SER55840.1 TRAP-type C4-dicarboxylate transport system, substrate-binding protein [Faunimonas pinastri]
MRKLFGAAYAATVALGLTLAGQASAASWDMPTPYPDGNFHTKNIREFAAEVDKATNGGLKITLYTNGSLLKATEIKRAVQTGQVQAGEVLLSSLANEDPIFGIDSIPGLATNYDDAHKLWRAAHDTVAKHMSDKGMVLLFSVAWPPQGIYSKQALQKLSDLKGLKFRTYNPATARFAELVGAAPVTVQAAEVAQAFRTGVVDAMLTSGATGVDTQAWDYLKYYYDLQAFLPQNIVFVNKKTFDALPADQKKAVMDAATRAEDRGWSESQSLNEGYKKTMAEKGMTVSDASDAMKTELAGIGKTMASEWAAKAGSDGAAILDSYRK